VWFLQTVWTDSFRGGISTYHLPTNQMTDPIHTSRRCTAYSHEFRPFWFECWSHNMFVSNPKFEFGMTREIIPISCKLVLFDYVCRCHFSTKIFGLEDVNRYVDGSLSLEPSLLHDHVCSLSTFQCFFSHIHKFHKSNVLNDWLKECLLSKIFSFIITGLVVDAPH